MAVDLVRLKALNAARWGSMHVNADKLADFDAAAKRLCDTKAKDRYQAIQRATGVPWFVVAVIHERESGQRWDRQLSQGDPLGQVSVNVPKGRGPFFDHPNDPPGHDAFYRAALDALIDCPPYASRWQDWSSGGTLTLLEMYNGLGYAQRDNSPSPYIWAGTSAYKSGKYVRDGVFEDIVDHQLGCAGILRSMIALDASNRFGVIPAPPRPLPPVPPEPMPVPKSWWDKAKEWLTGIHT